MQWHTVKTVFEIRFSKPIGVLSGKNQLLSVLSDGKKEIPLNDAVNVQDDKKKLSIAVASNKIGIVAETGDFEKDAKLISASYKTISNHFPLPMAIRMGIRRFSYLEVSGLDSYEEFVGKFREIFYNPSSRIINDADDVAISLLFNDKCNINIGPMRKDEIKSKFLEFSNDQDFPELYIFSDLDIFSNKAVTLTNSGVKKFLDEAKSTSDKYTKLIGEDWK